jgi:hypothetical protein
MTLSFEEFVEMLASIGIDPPASDHDKRRVVRIGHKAELLIRTDKGTKTRQTVRMKDFSQRGVCLVARHPLPVGWSFVLELPRKTGNPVQMVCTVAYCRTMGSIKHVIGAEFVSILDGTKESAGSPDEMKRIQESILT